MTTTKPKVSVAIPTHGMKDSVFFLRRCLDSLWEQTFLDFEVVITDNSEDELIPRVCEEYRGSSMKIQYFRNPEKGMAPNTNEAIRRSRGELIKILYMDDFLCEFKALERMVNRFDGRWLVTGCAHTTGGRYLNKPHVPYYSDDIHTGHNTIGSPSVMMILNKDPMFFDEKMQWLLDCDYYKRMHDMYGKPVIVKDILVGIGIHEGQATNVMGEERKIKEYEYITNKYR